MKTINRLILIIGVQALSLIAFAQNITLITPFDKDTIETFNPLFAWNYTNIGENRDDEDYIFTLVKIENDQSANAAVQVNNPLLRIEGIQGFQLIYPFDAPELVVNQRYGWRIQRRINGIITHESEAWEFIIWKEVILPMKYAVLNTDYNATVYDVTGEGFFFKLNSKHRISNYRIISDRNETIKIQFGDDQKLGTDEMLEKTGRDYYYLKTSSLLNGVYTVEIQDIKGNKYNTRFRIK